ncbi:sugar phosphate isomerase/epimerase [Geobacter sp. DSM 9736]|uniref:sugar phosphate isomerase/epimerase family protein n=1 Tax=Geobacter sp. DSM 9736 TaxID=1277350 RepID=UPI000B50B6AE|nr:sugar phosphate isomerase/epimerase family protein [Geobacter sp. DSM 9736]SNB46792.1 Sugar phosphate isomerase/epimerase [Geobacter sp. DSM 9736]
MQVGSMNHPQQDVVGEIEWMAEMGLDFIDLTLEPPAAGYWQIDRQAVRRALDRHRLGIVGHTAYYLPLGHPFEEIRKAAVTELSRCLECFAELGADSMNIHPDTRAPMHDREFLVRQNLRSLMELQEVAERTGVSLMVENLPGEYNNVEQLGELLDNHPELGLHLDLGHTNLLVEENTAEELLAVYGSRLRHVHLHDNRGGSHDMHLPLGAGTIDLPACVAALKRAGYDGPITLEVFTPDRFFVQYSAEKLRRIWAETPP